MKYCPTCKIKYNTSSMHCPLCQNMLSGECKEEELNFPRNIKYETSSMILKVLLFISITIWLMVGFIEIIFYNDIKVTFYTTLGLITNYIGIYHILKNYQNIYKMFAKQGFVIFIVLSIWYLVTRKNIIVDYIIPLVCILELFFNFIVGIVVRRNYLFRYSTQILINAILLILPMIYVIFGFTTMNLLAYVCCLLSIISIVGLMIFFSSEIKEELRKFFNI